MVRRAFCDLLVAVHVTLAGAACAAAPDHGSNTPALGAGTGGAAAPAASPGGSGAGGATATGPTAMNNPATGSGGTTAPNAAGSSPGVPNAGGTMTNGTDMAGAGGAGASAGSAGAGSAGMAGTAGMGGMAGSGAAGGGGMRAMLTPIVRGDAPTEISATTQGPYNVKSYTDGFPVNSYGGGTIWYPTDADPPFGGVAVCPGFVSVQGQISGWGPFLASHGIVMLTMDTGTPLDTVDLRADELMDALNSITSENSRADSPLNGKLDTMRLGVMGWSMGGGATWIDAATHPELRSAVTFAGHILTAVDQDITTDTVPTLMFAGSVDTAILGGGMSQPVYDEIPESTPKMIYEVSGAGHDVANDPSGTGGAIGRYGLSWQKVFLEGDDRYRMFLLEQAPMASDFRTNLK